LNSLSPSYLTAANRRKFDSFDLESADEIGIPHNGSRSIKNLDANVSSKNKILPLVPTVTLNNTVDEKNTTNGLFAYDHYLNMSNKSINVTFLLFES
jgi:hypothetical protein